MTWAFNIRISKLEKSPNVQEIEQLETKLDSLGAKMLQFDKAISADTYVIYVYNGRELVPLYYVEKR